MEAFRVNLANFRLPFLMPALFERRLLCGTLRLELGAQTRTFAFRDGYLVAASSSDPAEHLAQVLSDLRVLDAQVAVSAFEAAHDAGRPFGELLVDRGFVDRARLLEVLEHKARESFFDCYTWEAGELHFATDVPPVRGVELKLQVGPLHRDGLARLRERRRSREDRHVGSSAELEELLSSARSAFDQQDFERASELAARALERAPLEEAHALYRRAEQRLALALGDKELALEGRLAFAALPRPAPPQLTADDLYLYDKLKAARSVREALHGAAMGELAAWRSLARLRDAELVWETNAPSTVTRRRTEPQFGPAGRN